MPFHTVKQGECISRIAARYGFVDWSVIYGHADNADLRKKRPDPNIIHPGDRIFVPEREMKMVPRATGKSHAFTVRRPKKMLRLLVEDLAGEPVANAAYALVVEGKVYSGSTDGRGLVEQEVSMEAESGTLEIAGKIWPLLVGHLNPIDDTPDDGVSGIQARLKNLGYDPGPVDGELGPRTTAAVRAFQREHPPLAVDGICGPKTRAKLTQRHGC